MPYVTSGNVSWTPSSSATQRAVWRITEADGAMWMAATTRTHHRDDVGRVGYTWELGMTPSEGVGFHYTGARRNDLIWCRDWADRQLSPVVEALRTLANFVGAWHEALTYGNPNSDN